ncbi:MAG: HEAT repeat domain-containing protein [Candidatus Eisenbacteria bacterium]|nr:HEAT repeat domain-containing protein [Candidatus Eisenbacteria bacterium]
MNNPGIPRAPWRAAFLLVVSVVAPGLLPGGASAGVWQGTRPLLQKPEGIIGASPAPKQPASALPRWKREPAPVYALPAPPRGIAAGTLYDIAVAEDRRAAGDPRLGTWLADPAPAVRARAALAVGRIGSRAGLGLLLPLLSDPDITVRAGAAFAAGLLADSAALEPLARAAGDPSPEVRRRAVEALSKLGSRRAVPAVAARLRDVAREVRLDAAVGLWRLQDSTAVDSALPLLADRDPELRWRAAYALERGGSRRAPGAVRPLLRDTSETVRWVAARALGRMRDLLSQDALKAALSDPSWRVRVQAAAALGALADSSAGAALAAVLADSSAYVRATAATALGAMRFHGVLPGLLAMRDDPSPACRAAAGTAAARILRERALAACRVFLGDSTESVRAATLEALGEAGCRDAWSYATATFEGGRPRMRTAAVNFLGAMRDGHAMRIVLRALRDRDLMLAATAAQALAGSGDSSRVSEFEILYDRARGEANADARLAAADGAARLWPIHVQRFLRRALADPDPRVRAAAAGGLKTATGEDVPDSVLNRPLPESRSGWFLAAQPGRGVSRLPRGAVLRTARGDIRVAFETDASPNTVANFAGLAARGYFDRLTWHRVVPNFVIQGGDPHGDGEGGPGYAIRCEMNEIGYDPARVGMALSGKDTGGSQFFITQSPQPHLNGRYTIFGRVTQGMDVVERIQQGEKILSVQLEESPRAPR